MQLHRLLGGQEVRDLARRATFNSHRAVNGEGEALVFSLPLGDHGQASKFGLQASCGPIQVPVL